MERGARSASTYTLRELEAGTGFDKRTIAYYISCGLLPKVGRRGPKTTYSREFVDRLALIRRVKGLQDAGELRTVTLREMAAVLGALDARQVNDLAAPDVPDEAILGLFGATPDSADMKGLSVPSDWSDPLEGLSPKGEDARSPRMVAWAQRRAALARRHAKRETRGGAAGEEAEGEPAAFATEIQTADELSEVWMSAAARAEGDDTPGDIEAELTMLLTRVDERARSRGGDAISPTSERLLRVPITDDVLITVRNADAQDAGLVERLAALLRRLARRKQA